MEHHLANSARHHIELVKAHYNKIVTEKDKVLAVNNNKIVEKDKVLAEKDKILAEKNRLLTQKDKEITEINMTVVLQSEHISELNERITELTAQLKRNKQPMATGSVYVFFIFFVYHSPILLEQGTFARLSN